MTADFDNEKWVEFYRSAMLEFQHSLMAGRISDARAEIMARIEKLRDIPGLHAVERQAIEDALSGLIAGKRRNPLRKRPTKELGRSGTGEIAVDRT